MDWEWAKRQVADGLFVARRDWAGCWLYKRADGKTGVWYEDRKPTQYRSYRSNERAIDWYAIRKGEA
jgi:hypothetical protein